MCAGGVACVLLRGSDHVVCAWSKPRCSESYLPATSQQENIANMVNDPHTTDKVKLNQTHYGRDIYKQGMYYDALVIYKSSRSFKFPEKVRQGSV